jgi:hypothetical protein
MLYLAAHHLFIFKFDETLSLLLIYRYSSSLQAVVLPIFYKHTVILEQILAFFY